MILTVAFVALLLCAESHAGGSAISKCDDWACFASRRCFGKPSDVLFHFDHLETVADDCPGIIMIKPYSSKKWQVVIESWNTATNEVKLLKDSTELVSCKKGNPKAASVLAGFKPEETPSTPVSGKTSSPLSCQFYFGDGSTESSSDVIDGTGAIQLLSDANVANTMQADDFKADVEKKQKCDVSNVKFEESNSADEVVKRPDVQLRTVSCSDTRLNLQYKTSAGYENVDKISCNQTAITENGASKKVYKYKIGNDFKDGEIYARCHAKYCSFCTLPTTPANKTAPVFGKADGCKTLTCPKSFKIDDKTTDDKAECVKTDGDKFAWKIGESTVTENTAVECFEPKTCEKIKTCSDPCNLDSTTYMPSCNDGYELSAKIDKKDVKNFTIACDPVTGLLKYTEKGKVAAFLPDDSTFSCTAVKQSEEKVATGGSSGVPSPLQACIAVASVLSLLLIVLSVGLWYWRKRKNEAKAAADSKSKPEKEKGAKDKGEAKQEE